MFDFLKPKPKAWEDLPAQQFAVALQQEKAPQLLDVRSPGEFAEGHLPGAKNINVSSADFGQRIGSLDKTRPVFVYCRSGMRSSTAAGILAKAGFTQIHNLRGGVMDWNGPLKR